MSHDRFTSKHPIADSLWHAEARNPAVSHELEPGRHFDVAIIGAGVVGASCALRLQEAGVSVGVVDADEPGSGATGRSAGFVVPSFSAVSPRALTESMGEDAEHLLRAVAGSASLLFDFVRSHGIACDAVQGGWHHPAHSAEALERILADFEVWRGAGADIAVLDSADTERLSGIRGYSGCVVARSGGTLQPVDLARGAMNAAIEKGARFYGYCPAHGIEHREQRWHVRTEKGSLSSDRLLVCTNARSAQLGHGLEECVVPLRICQIATEPLAKSQRAHLLQQGQSLADTQTNLFTYRFDSEWRLITGAMPVLPVGSGDSIARAMAQRLASVLSLPAVPRVEHVWFGEASVTGDRLPAVYDIGPDAFAMTACNGRGLAASSMLAARMVDALLSDDLSRLPLRPVSPQRIPARPLQKLGARLYPLYGRTRDALGL